MTFISAAFAVMFWETAFVAGTIAFIVTLATTIAAARWAYKTFNLIMKY